MSKYKKHFLASLITLCSILFILLLLFILRTSPYISEGWSRSISRVEEYISYYIFGWLPISGFELFVIAVIIYIIIWLIFTIRHLHRFKFRGSSKYWLNLGIVLSLIFTVYMGTAGMEYNRFTVPIPQHTELLKDPLEYKTIGKYFQDDFNSVADKLKFNKDGSLVNPYNDKELNQVMETEYKRLTDDYFTSLTPKYKNMYLLGWLYREFQITGVAFAPTGEPNVNPLIPASEYPFTIAHEIAHTKGIIREEDANLVAAYICLTSKDPFLRYSGYTWTISSMYYLVRCTNVEKYYTDFVNGFSQSIYDEISFRYNYWKSHDILSEFSNFINNIYLMIQGDKGTVSYSDNLDIKSENGIYTVNSYSRYQALYLYIYFNK